MFILLSLYHDLNQHDIIKISKKYILTRWSSKSKKDVYAQRLYEDFKNKDLIFEIRTYVIFQNYSINFHVKLAQEHKGIRKHNNICSLQ